MNATSSKIFDAGAAAARVIAAVVRNGRFLDTALANHLAHAGAIDPRRAALVQELAYGTLRWFHQLSGVVHSFVQHPLKARDSDVQALLLIGLYQLFHGRTPAHAVVSRTVSSAETLGKPWAKGLINACLRAALRETKRTEAALASSDSVAYSHPEWLIRLLQASYPDKWRDILNANNQRPPLTLRVNLTKSTRAQYLERLRRFGINARAVEQTDAGVVLAQPVPTAEIPGFDEGDVFVQDAAAQLAAVLLDARPGDRTLDACAAPGGKTTHLMERCQHSVVVALEPDRKRLLRLRQNLTRMNQRPHVVVADAAARCLRSAYFDRVLADVPCSATGVIRRHPDIKVRRGPEEIEKLVEAQSAILDGVWPCLKPGGKLLYVTCSVLSGENAEQIANFLDHHSDARECVLTVPSARRQTHGCQILPGEGGMDGFYYACLEKLH